MALAVTVGDVYTFSVVHSFDNVAEQINVYDFKCKVGAVVTETEFNDDVKAMFSAIYSSIEVLISSRVNALEIRWRNRTDAGPTSFVPWTGSYIGGTGGADAMAPQNAALVLFRTGLAGVQGKKYMPTFTESAQSGGELSAGVVSDMQTWADQFASPIVMTDTSIEWYPSVWSRRDSTSYVIQSGQARVQLAVQRDRRIGRGS